jgi:putative holliday junction resolvase
MSAILGIDYGTKRIGLAIADKKLKFVRPLAIIANDKNTVLNISEYISSYAVSEVVLGLPRNLDGEETDQSVHTREFANRLASSLNISIHLQDESLTTVKATEGVNTRSNQKQPIDSFAAAIILEDYLNA